VRKDKSEKRAKENHSDDAPANLKKGIYQMECNISYPFGVDHTFPFNLHYINVYTCKKYISNIRLALLLVDNVCIKMLNTLISCKHCK